MKLFQVLHSYPQYIEHFESKYSITDDLPYEAHRKKLISDRFYAAHILKPCLENTESFYTMWNYGKLQVKWAKEKGWAETDLKKILFAQIEEKKPDVFYNASPIRFTAPEIREKIDPKIVKLAWFASPEKGQIDFSVYHSRLTNYPVDAYKKPDETGFRSDLFSPAHDPEMDAYASNEDRPIDILFYGQYIEDYFKNRNILINQLSAWKRSESGLNIVIALKYTSKYLTLFPFKKPGQWNRLLNSMIRVSPPGSVIKASVGPLYGIDLYKKIGSSKIVFNAAVDFSGNYKVNMRNFESLGCGAHMISDQGLYPDFFQENANFSTYSTFEEFKRKAVHYLGNPEDSRKIARSGYKMISEEYSKEKQWKAFEKIVSEVG